MNKENLKSLEFSVSRRNLKYLTLYLCAFIILYALILFNFFGKGLFITFFSIIVLVMIAISLISLIYEYKMLKISRKLLNEKR